MRLRRFKQSTQDYLYDICERLQNYAHSFWRDGLLPIIWPFDKESSLLTQLRHSFLWDGRLDDQALADYFEQLVKLSEKSRYVRQTQVISLLAEIADGLRPKDLERLAQAGVSKTRIQLLMQLQYQAYEQLNRFAGREVTRPVLAKTKTEKIATLEELTEEPLASTEDKKIQQFKRNGVLSKLYAHYLLWCLGHPKSKKLQPLFWLYKLVLFYFKVRLFWTVGQGFKLMWDEYLDRLACERKGKLWRFMERAGAYKCVACDLPVPYNHVFDIQDCAKAYFSAPRSSKDIINFFKKFNLDGL